MQEPSEAHVNPLRLDLAVRSAVDQILSRRRKGITTSKPWIGEAQAEIKGSLEEVAEGDQTVVVAEPRWMGASIVDPLHRASQVPLAEHIRLGFLFWFFLSFFFSSPASHGRQTLMSRWHKGSRSDEGGHGREGHRQGRREMLSLHLNLCPMSPTEAFGKGEADGSAQVATRQRRRAQTLSFHREETCFGPCLKCGNAIEWR